MCWKKEKLTKYAHIAIFLEIVSWRKKSRLVVCPFTLTRWFTTRQVCHFFSLCFYIPSYFVKRNICTKKGTYMSDMGTKKSQKTPNNEWTWIEILPSDFSLSFQSENSHFIILSVTIALSIEARSEKKNKSLGRYGYIPSYIIKV